MKDVSWEEFVKGIVVDKKDWREIMGHHDDTIKIVSASIENSGERYGNKAMHVTLENGDHAVAFHWYDDELFFTTHHVIGLTLTEAKELKRKKDVEYLRS